MIEIKTEKIKLGGKINLLVIPLFKDADFGASAPPELKSLLQKRQREKDFKGRSGESLLILPDSKELPKKIMLAGFGKKKKISGTSVRVSAALAIKEARNLRPQEMAFLLPRNLVKHAGALSEGFGLGNYNPAKYQTGKNRRKNEKLDIKKITILFQKPDKKLREVLYEGIEIAEAVNVARDLVNAPPMIKNVDYLAEKSRQIARENGCKITVLDADRIGKLKMGGILGVSRGSAFGPKLVIMEHRPFGSPKNPVIIAGKGIIFDSGGYDLKPRGAMREMNLDMAGAAAVMGLFMLLKKLKIRQHVVGIFALTDNLIGAKAQKPSDIITTYSGKTVEISNTDAEGRLILCDTISYALKRWKPRYLIDIATLTGACMIALGERYAGLFSNDDELMAKLKRAGDESDELLWPLPLHPDYAAKMKSEVADLRNWDEVPFAGASKGAAFLQFFVEKNKWAHLDIAAPAYAKDPKKYESPRATGYGVRLLLQFLRKL